MLNVKAVVAAFNQEKALVGAFSVIVKLHLLIVYSSSLYRVYTEFIQSCHGQQLNNPSPFKCNLLWVIILMLKDQIYILYEFR